MSMQPFKIEVPQATLDDLQARLTNTRWFNAPAEAGWTYGIDLGYMKELVDY